MAEASGTTHDYSVYKVFGENIKCVIYFYFKKMKDLFGQPDRFGLLLNLDLSRPIFKTYKLDKIVHPRKRKHSILIE